MKRSERGFIGKVLVFILSVLAVVGLIAMVMSVLNGYINPKRFVWTSYFGLAFWVIFVFNVLIFFLLLLLWSRKVWIAVLALVVSIPGINKSYSFGSKVEERGEKTLKVMSYNLHNFKHVDGKTNKEDFVNQVISMVREQSPDILCCQEFTRFTSKVTRPKCIEIFANETNMPYVYYNRKQNYGGNVVFSKYPLTKVTEDCGFGEENTYGVMVSVDAGELGRFHVANIHLLSYKITDNEIDKLTTSSELREQIDTLGMSLIMKLKYAFEKRSDEITRVLEGMPPVDGPVLVCGDFNETPMSYCYKQMQKAGFIDTFTKAGRGIKPTYARKLPLLRIDYVWANNLVTPICFKRFRQKVSDHYPIMLEFTLNKDSIKIENQTDTVSETKLYNTITL